MIDLYQLLEKQEYSEVELADGTSLVIRYDSGKPSGTEHTVEWTAPGPIPGNKFVHMLGDSLLCMFQGKTARIAITAAIQARYGES